MISDPSLLDLKHCLIVTVGILVDQGHTGVGSKGQVAPACTWQQPQQQQQAGRPW